jgi:hypothetical protein
MTRKHKTLQAELDELERTDPAVAAASKAYDAGVKRILSESKRAIGPVGKRTIEGSTLVHANDEVRTLLAQVDRLNARIARMQSEPAYREDAFALVEREMRATGADYITLNRVKPQDKSWGNGGPLKEGTLMARVDMLKERGGPD